MLTQNFTKGSGEPSKRPFCISHVDRVSLPSKRCTSTLSRTMTFPESSRPHDEVELTEKKNGKGEGREEEGCL